MEKTKLLVLPISHPLPQHPPKKKHRGLILLVVLWVLWVIVVHVCPHFRNKHPQSHHVWVSNGTFAEPPSALHLHYDGAVDQTGISLWFHKYVREAKKGEHEEEEGEGHHHGDHRHHHDHHRHHRDHPKGGHKKHGHKKHEHKKHEHHSDSAAKVERKKWFTRCTPTSTENGVATFGNDCINLQKDFEEVEKGVTITYALIGVGKKKEDDHDGDNDDDDDEDEDNELNGLHLNQGWFGWLDAFNWVNKGRRYYVVTKIRIHKHLE